MMTRLTSAIFALAGLFAVLYVDLILHIPIANYVLAAIILMALYEIYHPFGFIKRFPLAILGFALGISLAFGKLNSAYFVTSVICFYMLLMFILALLYHKTIKFSDICILLFSTLYVSLGLAHIRLILESEFGGYLLYVVLIGTIMTDSGAYFVGRFFGKTKLIPEISPKKTVEGAVGGIVTAIISFVIFGFVITHFFAPVKPNWAALIFIGLCSSVGAQLGDLAASMIKRELNLKDYGEIMPGHGGVLDRLDSMIFVAPIVFYFNAMVPILIK